MRRHEQEITSLSEIEAIIQKAKTCRLSFCDEDRPYIIPVCYGYEEGSLYFHCASEGLKLDIIKKNQNVCFQMDADVQFLESTSACSWSLHYKSVVGRGKASVLKGQKEKLKALQVIMHHYSSQDHDIENERLDSVTLVKIKILELTGKKSVS
jgi:nitroimidazol reductase NimA-like FMN-containing flavoprotein (pyridoxamine 5'-phosphate oxidase superfamily)